jgi:hypothetical protein
MNKLNESWWTVGFGRNAIKLGEGGLSDSVSTTLNTQVNTLRLNHFTWAMPLS